MKCRECNKNLHHESCVYLNGADNYFCFKCMPSMQPERLNPEDVHEIREKEDLIIRKIFEENPSYYDSNGDLPLIFDKNLQRLSHQEIMNICDSPNPENK